MIGLDIETVAKMLRTDFYILENQIVHCGSGGQYTFSKPINKRVFVKTNNKNIVVYYKKIG